MSYTVPGVTTPVAVDYTSRDFTSILSDLETLIPTFLPVWTSTSANDFGIVMLELYAYEGDIQNYYIDRVANESYLGTAQQMSSVLNLAYLINYSPQGPVPSSAVIALTVPADSPSFSLPVGTQFSTVASSTSTALIFELSSTHTIPANGTAGPVTMTSTVENDVTVPLTVVQGQTIYNEADGTSDGSANQSFSLFNTGVIETAVIIYVDEGNGPIPWTSVTYLADAGPYDAVYQLSIDANGIVYVQFGDGTNGRIPNQQAVFTATYRIGGGSVGNVGANQITTSMADSSIAGYISSVTNPAAASGGADAETINQIQNNAPQSLTAAGRCVTVQDYAAVSLTAPGVSKASSVAGNGLAITLYVHPGGGPYSATDLESLITADTVGLGPILTNAQGTGYLDTRKMAGTTVTVLPPQTDGAVGYVQVVITIQLQVQAQYLQTTVLQNVQTAISNLMDFGAMNFGQRISLSSVYAAAYAAAGVDWLVITQMNRSDASEAAIGDIVCGPSEIPVITSPDLPTSQVTIPVVNGGL